MRTKYKNTVAAQYVVVDKFESFLYNFVPQKAAIHLDYFVITVCYNNRFVLKMTPREKN